MGTPEQSLAAGCDKLGKTVDNRALLYLWERYLISTFMRVFDMAETSDKEGSSGDSENNLE